MVYAEEINTNPQIAGLLLIGKEYSIFGNLDLTQPPSNRSYRFC